MDAELVELAGTAGTTVVALLVTDAWERAKSAVAGLWRRVHPERAEAVVADLVETRAELLAARAAGDAQVEEDLVGQWQGRLRRLLAADPSVADPLRHLVEELRSHLPAGVQVSAGDVTINATASEQGTNNVVVHGTQYNRVR